MVDRLKPVHGLRAIVLGGSYASSSERPDSDIDIGLYYTLLGATGTTNAQLQESLAKTEALYNELATPGRERKG
jgi:predicted nucleotidyltransferase